MTRPVDRETALDVIRARLDDMRERLQVDLLGLFGSLARGEATPDSDADVLANFLKGVTLFRIARAQLELEEVLGRRVDLVERSALREHGRPGVVRDFLPA